MAVKQDKMVFKKDAFSRNASKLPKFENHEKQTQKNTCSYQQDHVTQISQRAT